MGVKREESALGSQDGMALVFCRAGGLPGTLHFHWPRGLGEDKLGQYAIPSPLPPCLRTSGTRGYSRQLAGKAQSAYEQGQKLLLKGHLPVVLRLTLDALKARRSAVPAGFMQRRTCAPLICPSGTGTCRT
jgi:hypothetical protein